MHRVVWAAAAGALALSVVAPVFAQLSNTAAPVVVGHFHLNVTSVDAHKKFWVETLGGKADKLGENDDVVRFPDTMIVLHRQAPTGPARGTAFDHVGFAVPNVRDVVTKVVANGYQTTNGREPKPGQTVSRRPRAPPEEIRGCRVHSRPRRREGRARHQRDTNPPPIKYHHVHFINKQYVEMQQWYMKAFDATLRPGQTDFFIGADLPGVGYSLNFFRWEGDQSVTHVPTAGRVYDHVGFEVKNLEEFCRKLEAKGIKLTVPYSKVPALNNMAHAFITDPWGVSIELTEGLEKALSLRYESSASCTSASSAMQAVSVRSVRGPMPTDRKPCASSSAVSNAFQPPSGPIASSTRPRVLRRQRAGGCRGGGVGHQAKPSRKQRVQFVFDQHLELPVDGHARQARCRAPVAGLRRAAAGSTPARARACRSSSVPPAPRWSG